MLNIIPWAPIDDKPTMHVNIKANCDFKFATYVCIIWPVAVTRLLILQQRVWSARWAYNHHNVFMDAENE